MAERQNQTQPPTDLCDVDQRVLDALIESMSPGQSPPHRLATDVAKQGLDDEAVDRVEPMARLLDTVGQAPVDDPPADLVANTMQAVADANQRKRFGHQIQTLAAGPSLSFRWRELITVAAVLMIGVSLLWPVMNRFRVDARQARCGRNLANAGMAFGKYGADHNGQMPRGAVRAGADWWRVGQQQDDKHPVRSNSANLYLLIRQKYAHPTVFNCPTNPFAPQSAGQQHHDWPTHRAISYSYQNQFRQKPIRIDRHLTQDQTILADRNPLFSIAIHRRTGKLALMRTPMPFKSPSQNHLDNAGNPLGHNTLTTSGQVTWSTSPIQGNGDNIWMLRGTESYIGNEVPTGTDDVFLVP